MTSAELGRMRELLGHANNLLRVVCAQCPPLTRELVPLLRRARLEESPPADVVAALEGCERDLENLQHVVDVAAATWRPPS